MSIRDCSLGDDFFESVLNSLIEQIVIIDDVGSILFVNESWKRFYLENGGRTQINWLNMNYLQCCIESSDDDSSAVKGIKAVLSQQIPDFIFEYPCHSPDAERYFLMRVCPISMNGENSSLYVITHQDITERKCAEKRVIELSETDPLTGIANRRKFDQFSKKQWENNLACQNPISILMIDIDFFKLINDRYGHDFGDKCLVSVANILRSLCHLPMDLCARHGGEEFIIFLGDMSLYSAKNVANTIMSELKRKTQFNNTEMGTNHLTVSIGIATYISGFGVNLKSLIQEADRLLYQAKRNGRNRIECNTIKML